MSSRRPVRLVTHALSAALLITPVCVAAQDTGTGWTMAARLVTDSGTGGAPSVMRVRMMADHGKTRTEITNGADSVATSVLLLDAATRTMTALLPAKQIAMVSDEPGVGKSVFSSIRMDMHGTPTYTVDDLGDGGVILGHPTHKYREHMHYVMRATLPAFTCDRTTDYVSEVWATTDGAPRLDLMEPMRQSLVGAMTGDARTALASLIGNRIPGNRLRSSGDMAATLKDGTPIRVKTMFETTELARGPVDSSVFLPPAGYQVMDSRGVMSGMDPSMMASAMAEGFKKNFCDRAPKP